MKENTKVKSNLSFMVSSSGRDTILPIHTNESGGASRPSYECSSLSPFAAAVASSAVDSPFLFSTVPAFSPPESQGDVSSTLPGRQYSNLQYSTSVDSILPTAASLGAFLADAACSGVAEPIGEGGATTHICSFASGELRSFDVQTEVAFETSGADSSSGSLGGGHQPGSPGIQCLFTATSLGGENPSSPASQSIVRYVSRGRPELSARTNYNDLDGNTEHRRIAAPAPCPDGSPESIIPSSSSFPKCKAEGDAGGSLRLSGSAIHLTDDVFPAGCCPADDLAIEVRPVPFLSSDPRVVSLGPNAFHLEHVFTGAATSFPPAQSLSAVVADGPGSAVQCSSRGEQNLRTVPFSLPSFAGRELETSSCRIATEPTFVIGSESSEGRGSGSVDVLLVPYIGLGNGSSTGPQGRGYDGESKGAGKSGSQQRSILNGSGEAANAEYKCTGINSSQIKMTDRNKGAGGTVVAVLPCSLYPHEGSDTVDFSMDSLVVDDASSKNIHVGLTSVDFVDERRNVSVLGSLRSASKIHMSSTVSTNSLAVLASWTPLREKSQLPPLTLAKSVSAGDIHQREAQTQTLRAMSGDGISMDGSDADGVESSSTTVAFVFAPTRFTCTHLPGKVNSSTTGTLGFGQDTDVWLSAHGRKSNCDLVTAVVGGARPSAFNLPAPERHSKRFLDGNAGRGPGPLGFLTEQSSCGASYAERGIPGRVSMSPPISPHHDQHASSSVAVLVRSEADVSPAAHFPSIQTTSVGYGTSKAGAFSSRRSSSGGFPGVSLPIHPVHSPVRTQYTKPSTSGSSSNVSESTVASCNGEIANGPPAHTHSKGLSLALPTSWSPPTAGCSGGTAHYGGVGSVSNHRPSRLSDSSTTDPARLSPGSLSTTTTPKSNGASPVSSPSAISERSIFTPSVGLIPGSPLATSTSGSTAPPPPPHRHVVQASDYFAIDAPPEILPPSVTPPTHFHIHSRLREREARPESSDERERAPISLWRAQLLEEKLASVGEDGDSLPGSQYNKSKGSPGVVASLLRSFKKKVSKSLSPVLNIFRDDRSRGGVDKGKGSSPSKKTNKYKSTDGSAEMAAESGGGFGMPSHWGLLRGAAEGGGPSFTKRNERGGLQVQASSLSSLGMASRASSTYYGASGLEDLVMVEVSCFSNYASSGGAGGGDVYVTEQQQPLINGTAGPRRDSGTLGGMHHALLTSQQDTLNSFNGHTLRGMVGASSPSLSHSIYNRRRRRYVCTGEMLDSRGASMCGSPRLLSPAVSFRVMMGLRRQASSMNSRSECDSDSAGLLPFVPAAAGGHGLGGGGGGYRWGDDRVESLTPSYSFMPGGPHVADSAPVHGALQSFSGAGQSHFRV